MAMENKRIIQLNTERTTPTSGDYVMVDSATDGTAKYQLSKITDGLTQEIATRTAADTAINGELSQLKEDLSIIVDDEYEKTLTPATSTSSGWRLKDNGLSVANSNYTILKYAVKEGTLLEIVSDDLFQFQDSSNVPSSGTSHRVGITYGTGTYMLKAPVGVTYLIMSTPKTDSTAAVYTLTDKINRAYFYDDPTFPIESYGASWSGKANGKTITKEANEFTFDTYSSGGYRYFSMLSDQLYVSTGNDISSISADAYTLQDKLETNATYELSVITGDVLAGVAYIGIYDIHGNQISDRITPTAPNTEYKTTFVNGGSDVKIALLAQRSGRAQSADAKVTILLKKIYPEWIYGDVVNKKIRAGLWLHSGDASPMTLLHFSDIHGDGRELSRILSFANAHPDVVNDVISTGDMARASWLSDFNFWSDRDVSKVLVALGNHEYYANLSESQDKYTVADVIQRWVGDYASNWNVTIGSGKSYYYKDYASSGVRLIVLDCNLTGAEGGEDQKTWLTGVLADAKTNGLAVIIATHYVYLGASNTYSTITNPFTEAFIESEFESTYNWSPSVYTGIVQDFIDGGGLFACWLAGHRHKDIISYPTEYPNQLIVTVCQASPDRYYPSTITTSDLERTTGTATADAFNVVTVDTINHCVKIVRVGADLNTFMRPRDYTCYDYVTHAIVNR